MSSFLRVGFSILCDFIKNFKAKTVVEISALTDRRDAYIEISFISQILEKKQLDVISKLSWWKFVKETEKIKKCLVDVCYENLDLLFEYLVSFYS